MPDLSSQTHRALFPAPRLPWLLLALLSALAVSVAHADKGANEGDFKDRDGKTHHWTVQRSHLLEWEGKPFVPTGVVFRSAYLQAPNAATLQQDTAELDRLHSAGVHDLWIEPGRGLLESSPEQTQQIIDAVEARGFTYGLRVGGRFREPLVGFSPMLPAVHVPVSKLQPGAQAAWEVAAPGARRALYALVDSSRDEKTQNWAISTGEVVVQGDKAQIDVRLKNTKLLGGTRGMLFVVPEIQVEPEGLGSFGDLWAGMEQYEDRLRRHLKEVKFGPGFRFLLDPFSAGSGLSGREDEVFPSSEAFHQAFREWMGKRGGIATVNQGWQLKDPRVTNLDEASRLVPTWPRSDPPEGDGWLLDPLEHQAYRCVPRRSTIWQDLDTFRAETLRRWMNNTATVLRQDGLSVPTLFTWASYHPLFNNSPSALGYDGLAAELYGQPTEVAQQSGAFALAQAEESDRNTWLIAAHLAGPQDDKDFPTAFADAKQAQAAWEGIRSVGFRGAYFDPKETPNAAELAVALGSNPAGGDDLRKPVPIIFFPMVMATADRVTRLSNGVWWLPSASPASLLRYGDKIAGYEIGRPLGSDNPVQKGTVLWSTSGSQMLTFYADPLAKIAFYDSAGQAIPIKPTGKKKSELHVTLTEEPTVITGLDVTQMFPLELAQAELLEFESLIVKAETQKIDTTSYRNLLDQDKKNLTAANAALVYNQVNPNVVILRDALEPVIWLEGERAAAHNLSGIAFRGGCSAGTYLKLDRRDPPATGVYRARYYANIGREASYDVWVAGKVPGRPGASPLYWQIDDEPASPLKTAEAAGPDYTPGMAWFTLGKVTLKPGRHELLIAFPERSSDVEGRYSGAIDAVVFSREAFKPNGIEKPFSTTRMAGSGPGKARQGKGK